MGVSETMVIKLGMRVACATRPDETFVVAGFTKTRATLKAKGCRSFSVAIKNIYLPMREKTRRQLGTLAGRLGLTVYELHEQYEKVHRSREQARAWLLAGGNPKRYVRKGYPKNRKRPGRRRGEAAGAAELERLR